MKFDSIEQRLAYEASLLSAISVGDVYRHHKNQQLYTIIGFARDSETLQLKVVYQAMYTTVFGQNSVWVRDLFMFLESVEYNGQIVPRFSKVS